MIHCLSLFGSFTTISIQVKCCDYSSGAVEQMQFTIRKLHCSTCIWLWFLDRSVLGVGTIGKEPKQHAMVVAQRAANSKVVLPEVASCLRILRACDEHIKFHSLTPFAANCKKKNLNAERQSNTRDRHWYR